MLKLSNTHRGWIALVVTAWVALLLILIFAAMNRPSATAADVAPTNSLTKTVSEMEPAPGAVVAQLVDPARVYDAEKYVGYTTLCPGEPAQLQQAKLQAFGMDEEAVDLGGDYGYMLLAPADPNAEAGLDQVPLDQVNLCTVAQTDSFPLNTSMPLFYESGQWALGVAQ